MPELKAETIMPTPVENAVITATAMAGPDAIPFTDALWQQVKPRHVSHDETVAEILKKDPAFANEYLAAAQKEAELPGGQTALLAALRHIAQAQD